MKRYDKKRILKVVLWALLVLLILGSICYQNISPIDTITGASATDAGLQEDGAISHLINGESR